jgi:hypothetical protein
MSRKKIGIAAGSVVAAGAIIAGGAAIANAADSPTPSPTSSGSLAHDGAGGGRGPGGQHVAATADQSAKVKAAVKAKDSAVTVTEVLKDPDGSFDASGTKAGARIRFDVSADFKTVTEATGGPGRPGGPGQSTDTPVTGAEAAKVTAAVRAKDSAVTVTTVRKDPDGSYDVLGTKAAADVFYDVSKDLTTITLHSGGPGGPGGHSGPGGPGAPGGPAGAIGTPAPSATAS